MLKNTTKMTLCVDRVCSAPVAKHEEKVDLMVLSQRHIVVWMATNPTHQTNSSMQTVANFGSFVF
jgi:hypothetical protein